MHSKVCCEAVSIDPSDIEAVKTKHGGNERFQVCVTACDCLALCRCFFWGAAVPRNKTSMQGAHLNTWSEIASLQVGISGLRCARACPSRGVESTQVLLSLLLLHLFARAIQVALVLTFQISLFKTVRVPSPAATRSCAAPHFSPCVSKNTRAQLHPFDEQQHHVLRANPACWAPS